MLRRALLVAAVAVLVAAQTGCRSQCGERRGLFTSNARSEAPCQTVGRNTGCFDAATGQPVPCPTGAPTTVVPGGAYPLTGPMVPGRGIELGPMPNLNENELIRPPAVPIPAPAPNNTLLPFPAQPGTPVRGSSNK